jgi:8-amino-7-oxononanoate synthase
VKSDFLSIPLNRRRESGALRSLSVPAGLADFCSNDYLGFARDPGFQSRILEEVRKHSPENLSGSTGSRLISGNSKFAEETEAEIAAYHHAEAGVIFNSGYDANIGLFSSVPGRGDTVIYDELVHASIRDGIRLSLANSFSFRHNDLNELEHHLKKAKGTVFVGVESVYSMDGDKAPLKEQLSLCEKYGAHLIADEAHATGVFGKKGEGLGCEYGIEDKLFARVHTFGKALGCHGGFVAGSSLLRMYLVNFARSFIYTTALPLHSLIAVRCAYSYLENNNDKILILNNIIKLFKEKVKIMGLSQISMNDTPVQVVMIPGNEPVKLAANKFRDAGLEVKAILSPTVPAGKERIRISLHTFNTEKEMSSLCNAMKAIFAGHKPLAV